MSLQIALVSGFATSMYASLSQANIDAIDASLYDGLGLRFINNSDVNRHQFEEFDGAMTTMLDNPSSKPIWPWVFLCRMYHGNSGSFDVSYFNKIDGIDIFDRRGAMRDFVHHYTMALHIAKRTGAAGIMIDHEPYGNYNMLDVDLFQAAAGISSKTLAITYLENFGRVLCRITDAIYPDAVLWWFSVGLGTIRDAGPPVEYRPSSHIALGMLKEAVSRGSTWTMVSAGELGLCYCSTDLADLNSKIGTRGTNYATMLSTYSNLKLGGCIAPWHDSGLKSSWALTNAATPVGNCLACAFADLTDFIPSIQALTTAYDYLWIYAAAACGNNATDADILAIYTSILGPYI